MNYLVLGAGMMGRAAAYDLAHFGPDDQIVLADIDGEAALQVARGIGPAVRPLRLDVNDDHDLLQALAGMHVVISAVSYSVNLRVARAALRAGVHMCDLGGNNEVVDRQLALDAEARACDLTILPNCGLAPGLINILAMTGANEFDTLDAIHLRVGGLPQKPRPPLNYQLVFSAEGLLNEYIEKATVIRDGKVLLVDSMADCEEISFAKPYDSLEAFNTSGGLSTLTTLLKGKVRDLDYKTIRYKGHCEKFKTLLDLGFAGSEPIMVGSTVRTSREFFTELLRKKLDFRDRDVVLARATITGMQREKRRTLAYEFIDYYDEHTPMTAMMRTTAFPTTIIARMLADGTIRTRGVIPPEACVPGEAMIRELGRRNITVSKTVT